MLQPADPGLPANLQWGRAPEPAAEFKARVQGSVDYTNSPRKGSKHWRGPDPRADPDPETAAAAAAAAQHTDSPQALAAAVAYSRESAVAAAYVRGWEQAREFDRRWKAGEMDKVGGWGAMGCCGVGMSTRGSFGRMPVPPCEAPQPWCKPARLRAAPAGPAPPPAQAPLVEQVGKSVPPPDLAPEQLRVFRAAERLAYVLRRWVDGQSGGVGEHRRGGACSRRAQRAAPDLRRRVQRAAA